MHELATHKKRGNIRYLVIMGCLSQRYPKELQESFSEADAMLGSGGVRDFPSVIEKLENKQKSFRVSRDRGFLPKTATPRMQLQSRHTAYVKISEGCRNRCSYCAIPQIKGFHRSRPIKDILEEIRRLYNEQPLSEIILIGQDTASYGWDLERKLLLPNLLEKTARLCPTSWVRALYLNPTYVSDELILAFKNIPNLCRYADIPVEHTHPAVLKRMNRNSNTKKLEHLINSFRAIPGMALRTTIMVGFPGETAKEFKYLLKSLDDFKFDRLGAFIYSKEDKTAAFSHPKHIRASIKKRRYESVMTLQREITAKSNEARIGQTVKVLIDEERQLNEIAKNNERLYIGRSERDIPEVDGEVYVHSNVPLKTGSFQNVVIEDVLDYDLIGRITNKDI